MIHKEGLSPSPSAPTLFARRDGRARGAANGVPAAPAPPSRAAATSIVRSETRNPDGIWIDVDRPAQALQRAEALARIRRREEAILCAFHGFSEEPPALREIPIQRPPAHRCGPDRTSGSAAAERASGVETGQLSMTPGSVGTKASPVIAREPSLALARLGAEVRRRGLIHEAATLPSLNFRFIAALLTCSTLAWLVAWVIVRFCQ